MKKQGGILMVGLLVVLVFPVALWAERHDGGGGLRGTFLRLTEQRVGEKSFMGIVIKPLERGEPVTVLLSQRQKELVTRARRLREGQRLGVAYITKGGHKWVRELEAARTREGRRQAEAERARQGTEAILARLHRLEDQVAALQAEVTRLKAALREGRGSEKQIKRTVRREGQPKEERIRDERPKSEREVVLDQLKVMRMAVPALKEADRTELAELLTLAIRAREMMLEGRRDEEARRVRERAPKREQLAEILSLAARLWREFGKTEKGAAVGQLAEQLAGGRRRPARERRDSPAGENQAVHVTVQAAEAGGPRMFFREERVSMEQLRELIHDLADDRLLFVHVRGEVSEELIHHITKTAEKAGIQRIKVEHIKRKRQVDRDEGPSLHLFLQGVKGGANIYYQERSISLEQIQEHLQNMDEPREFVMVLHLANDVPEKTVARLKEMARENGIQKIRVIARKKR